MPSDSIAPGAPEGIYRGWYVAIGSLAIAILAVGMTTFTFGLFVVPATKELGITQADANIVLIMIAIGSTLMSPVAGWLVDRFPVPLIMGAGALTLTAGLLIIAATSMPWLIALVALVMVSPGLILCSSIVVSTLATRWFRRRLGRVLGIVATSGTAGGIFVPPIAGLLLAYTDWRTAMSIMALAFGGIALFVCRFVVVSAPAAGELERWNEAAQAESAPGTTTGEREWSYGQLLRDKVFWLVALSASLLLANLYSIIISLASAQMEAGASVQAAALMVSVMTTAAVLGKLVMGYLSERVECRTLMGVCALAHLLMLASLTLNPGYWPQMLACAVTGLGLGGVLPLQAKLIDIHFGRPSYGTVMGLMGLIYQPFAIVSTRLVALVRDAAGGYGQAFASLLPGIALAFVLILILPAARPKPAGPAT